MADTDSTAPDARPDRIAFGPFDSVAVTYDDDGEIVAMTVNLDENPDA